MTRKDIYRLIDKERARQIVRWYGPHDWGEGDCSSVRVRDEVKAVVLAEECGEVARAVLDGGTGNRPATDQLRKELVQVAAVAVAWLEAL